MNTCNNLTTTCIISRPATILYFNGNRIGYHIWYYGMRAAGGSESTQLAVDQRDVKQYLTSKGNIAVVQGSAQDWTPLMVAAQDYLIVEYPDAFPGKSPMPSDLDRGGRVEDANGNGTIDFDDVVRLFDERLG